MCELVSASGADYIKTSTGFSTGGATREDVALFKAHVAPHVKIKAAGGIASLEDAEDFIRLWRTMYDFYTHEMGLNNLIWVLPHSGEFRAELNPGREYYDIAGADCYSNDRLVDLYGSVKRAYGESNILIPLHECGYLPDPEECREKGTLWSWWMLWHTDIIRDHDKDWIKKVYADPLILTLDELQRAKK